MSFRKLCLASGAAIHHPYSSIKLIAEESYKCCWCFIIRTERSFNGVLIFTALNYLTLSTSRWISPVRVPSIHRERVNLICLPTPIIDNVYFFQEILIQTQMRRLALAKCYTSAVLGATFALLPTDAADDVDQDNGSRWRWEEGAEKQKSPI